jgi:hypothetical protein
MERIIEEIYKQSTKVEEGVLDFKGDLNPKLFLDWIWDL